MNGAHQDAWEESKKTTETDTHIHGTSTANICSISSGRYTNKVKRMRTTQREHASTRATVLGTTKRIGWTRWEKTTHILDILDTKQRKTLPDRKLNQQITHWKYDNKKMWRVCKAARAHTNTIIRRIHELRLHSTEILVKRWRTNETVTVQKNHYIDTWLMREHLLQPVRNMWTQNILNY